MCTVILRCSGRRGPARILANGRRCAAGRPPKRACALIRRKATYSRIDLLGMRDNLGNMFDSLSCDTVVFRAVPTCDIADFISLDIERPHTLPLRYHLANRCRGSFARDALQSATSAVGRRRFTLVEPERPLLGEASRYPRVDPIRSQETPHACSVPLRLNSTDEAEEYDCGVVESERSLVAGPGVIIPDYVVEDERSLVAGSGVLIPVGVVEAERSPVAGGGVLIPALGPIAPRAANSDDGRIVSCDALVREDLAAGTSPHARDLQPADRELKHRKRDKYEQHSPIATMGSHISYLQHLFKWPRIFSDRLRELGRACEGELRLSSAFSGLGTAELAATALNAIGHQHVVHRPFVLGQAFDWNTAAQTVLARHSGVSAVGSDLLAMWDCDTRSSIATTSRSFDEL